MKRIISRKIGAFLCALVTVIGLTPFSLASSASAPVAGTHNHDNWSDWTKLNDTQHQRVCREYGCTEVETANHIWSTTYSTTPNEHWRVCTVCGAEMAHTAHTWMDEWRTDANYHWHICAICGLQADLGGHVDRDNNNKCDTCGYTMTSTTTSTTPNNNNTNTNTNTAVSTITVNFVVSGDSWKSQTINVNTAPANPGTPTKTASGKTYSFKGWTTSNPGSSALYTNQSYLTASQLINTTLSQNTTYYALFTVSSDIVYEVDAGKVVQFDRSDFKSFFDEQVRDSFRYVTFQPNSSLKSSVGAIYHDYKGNDEESFDQDHLGNYDFYYNSSKYGDYPLANLSFVASSKAEGKTLTIPFIAHGDDETCSGSLVILIGNTTAKGSGDIIYTVDPDKTVKFDRTDFRQFFEDSASNDSFRYVTFNPNNSLVSSSGAIYYDYNGNDEERFDRDDLDDYDFYYSSSNYGDYPLNNLSFVASSKGDGKIVTIPFTACGRTEKYTGTLTIKIGDVSNNADIIYEVAPSATLIFNRADFNDAYKQEYDGTLRYVTFSVTSISGGSLASGSKTFTRNNLSDFDFYYNSSSYGDYALSTLAFTANKDFDGEIKLSFRAYGSSGSGSVSGTVIIRSTDVRTSKISYSVKANDSVTFNRDDFKNVADKKLDGAIRYVTFTSSAVLSESSGTLYSNYGTSNERSFTKVTISNYRFYYNSSSDNDYTLNSLAFVAPRSSSPRTVELNYTIYDSNGDTTTGIVEITLTAASAANTDNTSSQSSSNTEQITWTVVPGGELPFNAAQFNSVYQKATNSTNTIRYVTFETTDTLSVSTSGLLYCNYGKQNEMPFNGSSLKNAKFYYSDSADGNYPLNNLYFVPSSSFKTPITLTFNAVYSSSSSASGRLVIQPGTSTNNNSSISNTNTNTNTNTAAVKNIRYFTSYSTPVQINADEISRFFRSFYPNGKLDSVRFTGLPSSGSLYYNYYNTSRYGSPSRMQLTTANVTGQNFYFSPSSSAQYSLSELTFIPATGINTCVIIPFSAIGTDSSQTVQSNILISSTASIISEVYGVTPKGQAVNLPATAIASAVNQAVGAMPAGIRILELPASNIGTLYVGDSTPANTSDIYAYPSGTRSMSDLRFVPNANYTGSVEIPYIALNGSNVNVGAGNFCLGVVNTRKNFPDVTSTTWCYKYVTELADAGVISGYPEGVYKPNDSVTYGAALKLIMLAAGYPEQAPTSSYNVFSGYLQKARADGIITRSNVDLTVPVTRLQVAQLASGALKLDTNNLSSVQPFTDTTDKNVQALNAAGIINGYFENGVSEYRPSNTLTRGQVAAIVWRMRNYNH